MNEFDRIIEDSLRHRAQRVAPALGSYGEVSRRIARRRRRSTSIAMAAITAPALLAVGWATTRPDSVPGPNAAGAASPIDENGFPEPTTTVFGPGQYRCSGALGGDGEWDFYQYCEFLGAFQTTTVVPGQPVPTTLLHPEALDHVLFLDASGGLPYRDTLVAMLGDVPRFEMAATTLSATVIMPVSSDVTAANDMLAVLGIGGLDSWSPELVGGALPEGVTAVVVIGTDFFSRNGSQLCAPMTTLLPTTLPPTTTTSVLGQVDTTIWNAATATVVPSAC